MCLLPICGVYTGLQKGLLREKGQKKVDLADERACGKVGAWAGEGLYI